jgi:hypothetical protein
MVLLICSDKVVEGLRLDQVHLPGELLPVVKMRCNGRLLRQTDLETAVFLIS